MPLPKPATGDGSTFQVLDREWAHGSPGEFHTGAMSDGDHRAVCSAYYAMCEHIDHEVGRILRALDESGQADNTIVIFMSDHGEMLGDHGLYYKGPHFYEEAIRVPLIMRWPGEFREGHRVTGLTELLDIAPSLLDAAGQPVPPRIQGHLLAPQLRDGCSETDRPDVFSEYYNSWTHNTAYGSMLRTENHKIVVYHGTDQGELYDLLEDPEEMKNLWSKPASAALKSELLVRCFDRSVFTMDPMPSRLGTVLAGCPRISAARGGLFGSHRR